jgi:spore germination protein KC
MLIAKGGDARDLFKADSLDQGIISLEIDSIITDDNSVTASTSHADLYQIYDLLNCAGIGLTLPAFHITDNNGKKVIELDGTAVFKDDKLAGYLSPEESKYFLIANNHCHGGILTLASSGSGAPDTSLEIDKSSAKTTYTFDGGRLAFHVETETDVYLAETMEDIDVLKEETIDALEAEAGKQLATEITAVIRRVQTELKTDIFGFGHTLHQRDFRLWGQVENQWETIFETLPVTVSCKINILNTAYITSRKAVKQ